MKTENAHEVVVLLRKHQYTYRELAAIAGVTEMTIRNWGKEQPKYLNQAAYESLKEEAQKIKGRKK